MPKVRFTPAADADLGGIFDYTLERYGEEQAEKYYAGLIKTFELLAAHPLIGSDQSDTRSATRRVTHQAHAIYYRVGGAEVVIVRILGPGQDPLEEL